MVMTHVSIGDLLRGIFLAGLVCLMAPVALMWKLYEKVVGKKK